MSDSVLSEALAGIKPNSRVLELDRKQPEFTMTWPQYRGRIVSELRITNGRNALHGNLDLLRRITDKFGVSPGVIVGIWGLETNYGAGTGGFNVIEALATLAWEGRRAIFFRSELLAALKILQNGDIRAKAMTGSWAGAMGQPQFMPTSYLRYAVDFDGDGRRDIWDSRADALGSIANYLLKSGWKSGEPWGQKVAVPAGFDASLGGRENKRSLGEWMGLGIRREDGTAFSRNDVAGALVLPDGAAGEAFMTYTNYTAIRRYNPSDFYALSVGLLGDSVLV